MIINERNKINLIKKDVKLKIALVYPNDYKAGMSSYAIHLIYSLFNGFENVICERFFLSIDHKIPFKRDLYHQDKNLISLKSVDSGASLLDFDIIAFSIHYEPDYLNILWILDSCGIPLLSTERAENKERSYPLLLAGGPSMRSNPLTLLNILDVIIFSDLETILDELVELFISYECYLRGFSNKLNDYIESPIESPERFSDFINNLNNLPNLLINSLVILKIKNQKTHQIISNLLKLYPKKRIYLENLSQSTTPNLQIIPEFKDYTDQLIFGETFLIELNRGCPYGCRFCLTGFLNKPYRNREYDDVINSINDAINVTKVGKITLIGSSIADHPRFLDICKYILEKDLRLMIPSIRLDKLTDELLDILKKTGIKSLTIAPETGSELLRNRLNKKISNEEIVNKVSKIFENGFESVKFYFLIGLPFETEQDILQIPQLMQVIYDQNKQFIPKNGLRLSINWFIPKINTPYGEFTQFYLNESRNKVKSYERLLKTYLSKIPTLSYNIMDHKEAYIQTILSQIDHNFSDFLIDFYNDGAKPVSIKRMEKHNDHKIEFFLQSIQSSFNIKLSDMMKNEDSSNELRIIDKIIDVGVKPDFLYKELKRANNV